MRFIDKKEKRGGERVLGAFEGRQGRLDVQKEKTCIMMTKRAGKAGRMCCTCDYHQSTREKGWADG